MGSIEETQKKLNQYFKEKLETFGATPKGVDYNGLPAQWIRFEALSRVIDTSAPFTVIDYGSGYGAYLDFLIEKKWQYEYYGVDLIEEMVIAGRELHKEHANAHFTTDEKQCPVSDYLIASGIFNVKMESPYEEWQEFVVQTLKRMDVLCSKGFSFNVLSKYSDADRMASRPDLFYADPLFLFDYCKRNFSRNVALLHDYGLYDFTILIRKDI